MQGTAQMSQSANTLTIKNTDKTIINWQSFNIDKIQTTRFIQPSSTSSVLNRVMSNNPSQILGNLQSNGQVFLINQHGILIGDNARINTHSFFASTLNISNSDFTQNKLKFNGTTQANISNNGFIKAGENGSIVLLASSITNGGVIEVNDGNILLAAGQNITITDLNNSNVSFTIESNNNQVTNLGSILAHKGSVSLFASTLVHRGTIQANGFVTDGDGSIRLVAESDNTVDGALMVSGEQGGHIKVLGDNITITTNAVIEATGKTQGGEILIGGDQQGLNPSIKNALSTTIASGAIVNASAITNGDGGKIITFAKNDIHIHGQLIAQGGSQSGNGGFIETSGLKQLDITTVPDASSSNGIGGTWLIDPNNITIVAGSGNTNINSATPFSTSNDSAQLGVDLITTVLNTGVSVIISTGINGTDSESGNITVSTNILTASTNSSASLTLNAHNNIELNANIIDSASGYDLILNPDSDSNLTGQTNITASIITVNDITFNGNGFIDSDLTINNDGAVNLNGPLTLNTAGSLTLNGNRTFTGTFNQEDATLTNNGTLNLYDYNWNGGILQGSGTTNVTNKLLLNTNISTRIEAHTLSSVDTERTSSSSGFFLRSGSHFINNGTFLDSTIHTIGNIYNSTVSQFTNNGTYTYDNAFTFKDFKLKINNNGIFNITSGKVSFLNFDGSIVSDLNIGIGTLKGIGQIKANVIAANGSTISPGNAANSAQTLTIDGNLTLENGSTISSEFETTAIFDTLSVTGTVQIDSGASLSLSAINGYSPSISDSFSNVIQGSSITGTFTNIQSADFTASTAYTTGLTLTIDGLVNSWTNGAGDGLWSSAGNWNIGVPTAGATVSILDGSSTVNATSINLSLASISTNAGTTLSLTNSAFTLNADSTLNGTLNLTLSSLTSNGNFTANSVTMNNSSLIGNNTNLTLNNPATFTNTNIVTQWSNVNSQNLNITGDTTFTNLNYNQQNNINIADGNSSLTFNNSTLNSNTGSTYSGTGGGLNFVTTSQWNVNNTLSNTGQINVGATNSDIVLNNGSSINFSDPSIYQLYSGSNLLGNGTIRGALNSHGGTINPGTSSTTGSINLIGNYTQGIQAFAFIDLVESTRTFDTFNVSGTANLNGTLRISNLGSNTLVSSSSFSPLNFGSTDGKFSTITNGTTDIIGGFNNGSFTVLKSDINFSNNPLSLSASHSLSQIIGLDNDISNSKRNSLIELNPSSEFTITAKPDSNSVFVCR